MRTTAADVTVRLYHLDHDTDGGVDGGGGAETLVYAPLVEALALAARQPAEVQAGLFIQTPDDVIAYLDIAGG
nr:hypothetical protein [Sphingomonas montana]